MMSNIDVKTAGQIMRERFFEIKRNRKFSPEIKEILEKNKEEFLKNKIDIKENKMFTPAQASQVGPIDEIQWNRMKNNENGKGTKGRASLVSC